MWVAAVLPPAGRCVSFFSSRNPSGASAKSLLVGLQYGLGQGPAECTKLPLSREDSPCGAAGAKYCSWTLGSASRQIALLASGLKFAKIPPAWRPAPNIVDLGFGLRHAESRLFGPGFAKISPAGRPASTIVDLGLGLTLLARNS